eukprot:scaffold394423_cov25-Prasinocladus_malaysianus.AAC.1
MFQLGRALSRAGTQRVPPALGILQVADCTGRIIVSQQEASRREIVAAKVVAATSEVEKPQATASRRRVATRQTERPRATSGGRMAT